MAIVDWLQSGQKRDEWPEFQRDPESCVDVIVINNQGKVYMYTHEPFAIPLEGVYAIGSGRDYAMGAMAMGADAIGAVKVASTFDIQCGIGVDTLTIKNIPAKKQRTIRMAK